MSSPGDDKLLTDDRECKDCYHSQELISGWICNKHLMAILPDMNVSYMKRNGTCWLARDTFERHVTHEPDKT